MVMVYGWKMRSLSRLLVAPLLALLMPACGGSSTPTAPAPAVVTPLFNILTGAYTLTLTMSQSGDGVCTGGICTGLTLCVGPVGGPSLATLTTLVRLDRSGDVVTVSTEDPAATFRIDLHMSGTALDGTVAGQFRDGAVQASVSARDGRSAATTTAAVMSGSVTGKIDGRVSIGGYSCSSNAHAWTLARH
jgi:hypothetical protein